MKKITLTKDVQISGTDVILETGDVVHIKPLNETTSIVEPSLDDKETNKKVVSEAASTKTAICPTCGNKYLLSTGYCLTCKKKVGKKEDTMKTITIEKEFQLPGTDIVLEEGDEISIVASAGETDSGDGTGSPGASMADGSNPSPTPETTDPPVQASLSPDSGETLPGDGNRSGPNGTGVDNAEEPESPVVTIKDDFQIPGTDLIVEAGDRIAILSETTNEIELLIRNMLNSSAQEGVAAAEDAATKLGTTLSAVILQSMPADMSSVFIDTLQKTIR